MLPGQKLILFRIEASQPPPLPVVAKSAPTEAEPLYLTIILWLLSILGRPVVRKTRSAWPQIVVLGFLATVFVSVVLESLAAGYIEKMLGA